MTRFFVRSAAAGVAAAVSLTWAALASADDVRFVPPSPTETAVSAGSSDDGGLTAWPGRSHSESARDSGPGGPLLLAGLVTLTISYVPAFVLASESTLPIDQKLFIPVAGPWVDLANRPACGAVTVPCSLEVGNQILLVTDGIVQAAGALEVLAGLATLSDEGDDAAKPDRRASLRPSLHVTPAKFGVGGYGLAAVGRF